MIKTFRSLRNQVDFFLRSQIRIGRDVPADSEIPPLDLAYQEEVVDFLSAFPWKGALLRFPHGKRLVVGDIGARNFALAPVLEKFFSSLGHPTKIHGIEIDAFRRYRDFRTRKDYGEFYARKAAVAEFHAMDFLEWQEPFDVLFLLNPFVTVRPTLAWGLPLNTLKPEQLFEHAFTLLKPSRGICLLSCPSPEEFEIAKKISFGAGFQLGPDTIWQPSGLSVQQQPRYGLILRS